MSLKYWYWLFTTPPPVTSPSFSSLLSLLSLEWVYVRIEGVGAGIRAPEVIRGLSRLGGVPGTGRRTPDVMDSCGSSGAAWTQFQVSSWFILVWGNIASLFLLLIFLVASLALSLPTTGIGGVQCHRAGILLIQSFVELDGDPSMVKASGKSPFPP